MKKRIFVFFCIVIIGLLVLNKKEIKMFKVKNNNMLADNEVISYGADDAGIEKAFNNKFKITVDESIELPDNFKSSKLPYKYDIKTGKMEIDGTEYKVSIAEDGVLLIYEKENESDTEFKKLLAHSKEDISDKLANEKNNDGIAHLATDITLNNIELYNNYVEKNGKSVSFRGAVNAIADEITKKLANYIKTEGNTENGIRYVILAEGTYLVDCYYEQNGYTDYPEDIGIVITSNTNVNLNGATIKQVASKKVNESKTNAYCIFRIDKGENITLTNGKLIGDKAERTKAQSQEAGHGIYLRQTDDGTGKYVTVKNVKFNNLDISYMSGDGIDIRGKLSIYDATYTSTGVEITYNYIHDCNRQGISLENANDTTISNNKIERIIGTKPQACIDIESTMNMRKTITSCSYSQADNIKIKDNYFSNDRVLCCSECAGDITVENNIVIGEFSIINCDGKFLVKNNTFKEKNGSTYSANNILHIGKSVDSTDTAEAREKRSYINGNTYKWKMHPQCVILTNNKFSKYRTFIYDGEFIEISQNEYCDSNSIVYCRIDGELYINNNNKRNFS